MSPTLFKVGAAKYTKAGYIGIEQYRNGEVALTVTSEDGEPQATATVAIQGAPSAPDHVWLKGWSENEGLPEALEAAGLVTLTGRIWHTGYADAHEAELSPALASAVKAVIAPRRSPVRQP